MSVGIDCLGGAGESAQRTKVGHARPIGPRDKSVSATPGSFGPTDHPASAINSLGHAVLPAQRTDISYPHPVGAGDKSVLIPPRRNGIADHLSQIVDPAGVRMPVWKGNFGRFPGIGINKVRSRQGGLCGNRNRRAKTCAHDCGENKPAEFKTVSDRVHMEDAR